MAIDLIKHLQTNPFVLAPMAGITDTCFRSFMRELGCGVVITELVSAHGIEHRSHRTMQLMTYEESQRPIGIQLFGETPEVLAEGARVVEDSGADFVDLNFGCPVPKVVKKGAGSAILKDLSQVERVFRAVRSATDLPVTVKIRTGWDHPARNAERVAEIAYNEGLTWVAIHGRTRAAGYSGMADWDYITEVKNRARIPIIGNGDIQSSENAVQRLVDSGCDGVMIGRGCLKNPWIFRESIARWRSRLNQSGVTVAAPLSHSETVRDFSELFIRLRATFEEKTEAKVTLIQMKKFASWYSSGYSGASQFRKNIFQTQSLEEVMGLTSSFFTEMQSAIQADTSQEAFLMGGHG